MLDVTIEQKTVVVQVLSQSAFSHTDKQVTKPSLTSFLYLKEAQLPKETAEESSFIQTL
jgi:hypothetical protein